LAHTRAGGKEEGSLRKIRDSIHSDKGGFPLWGERPLRGDKARALSPGEGRGFGKSTSRNLEKGVRSEKEKRKGYLSNKKDILSTPKTPL